MPGNSCRPASCYNTATVGCLTRVSGECVFYAGTKLAGPGINTGDLLDTVIVKLNNYIISSGAGTVTSVGLSVPAAFSVSGSPVTTSGTLSISAVGNTSQYIRGDGTLATLPTTTADNALTATAGNIELGSAGTSGSPLLHDTYINITDLYSLIFNATNGTNRTRFDQNFTNISMNADKEDFSLRSDIIASIANIQVYQQDNVGGTAGRRILLDRSTGISLGELDSGIYKGLIVKLAGLGQLQLNAYGSGTFTGTATRTLQVDASGNIIEGPVAFTSFTFYKQMVVGSGTGGAPPDGATTYTDATLIGKSIAVFLDGLELGTGLSDRMSYTFNSSTGVITWNSPLAHDQLIRLYTY